MLCAALPTRLGRFRTPWRPSNPRLRAGGAGRGRCPRGGGYVWRAALVVAAGVASNCRAFRKLVTQLSFASRPGRECGVRRTDACR